MASFDSIKSGWTVIKNHKIPKKELMHLMKVNIDLELSYY